MSALNIMNKSNIDNFKDQLEKYDVRRKSRMLRPDLLNKLKNAVHTTSKLVGTSKTISDSKSKR